MKDVKIVAYGTLDANTLRLIENYLEEKCDTVQVLNVDSTDNKVRDQEVVIAQQNELLEEYVARIEELEK